jgi:16S rRNA (guanine1207-N2)-methyltransferase
MSPYDQVHTFSARLDDQALQFISKPGMAQWDRVSPASQLLAAAAGRAPDARALVLGCGHGALGVALARRAGEVVLADTHLVAVTMARLTLEANAVTNARVRAAIGALPEEAAAFDAVVIEAPPDRGLVRRWLVEAHLALRPGGRLYLAGANDHGIRSAIADAATLFGHAAVLAYHKGNRVAQASKTAAPPANDWASAPGIAPGTWYQFEVTARGSSFRLRSLPGIFAGARLDEGTRLLLEALDIPAGAHVLDIGCGYGIIGLLAARLGAVGVDMVDVNLLAVAAAAENIALNDAPGARAFPSDGIPPDAQARYDVVATNPPFHIGKAIDYDIGRAFVDGARRALRPGGRIVLVGNRFLPYDRLLRARFEQVVCVAENKGFRVWSAA